MRRIICFYAAMLLIGCNQQKPKMTDAQMEAMRALTPGMTDACLDKIRWGGIEAMPQRSDECYKFEAPKLWKGVWINQFEGSLFCPDPAERTCPKNPTTYADEVWLEFASKPPVKLGSGSAYELQFVGRRSIGAGSFGHFGMSPNDIIVDRMLSIKKVTSPSK